MRRVSMECLVLVALVTSACAPTWKIARGAVPLSPAYASSNSEAGGEPSDSRSRELSITVPAGWHWYRRGNDLIATRDGVFLQQIVVERLHLDQVDQKTGGTGALTASAWPVRTAKNLTKRFRPNMPPPDAAEVLLASRRSDPGISGLMVRKIVTRTIAGRQAFRAELEFRVKSPLVDPSPIYRSVYCGFVLDEWFYGFAYTATAAYYFDQDAGTFETVLESVRLASP